MLFIRAEQDSDQSSIQSLYTTDSETSIAYSQLEAARRTNYFSKSLSFVALENNEIVAHLFFIRVVIKDNARTYPALALMHCIVHPDFRKKGIATQLIRESLVHVSHSGHHLIVTSGPLSYFKTLGFELAHTYDIIPPDTFESNAFLACIVGTSNNLMGGQVYYPIF